ncbi:MAG: Na/Pi cotransporter family protein [Lachnospiraceae bacterium]|nr:Na/Pi cotransporter family protein [Lachnospiraceae bacterium]
MNSTIVIKAILNLMAGIGVFLVACTMMSKNLEAAGSNKLKGLFEKASKSRLLGVGIGALGTAAIQSSGATTVMVIGFVNAGIMSLAQAATVIYGANIGTTITGQIVALGMFGGDNYISTTVIFSAMAGVGAFVTLFAKKSSHKVLGGILSGFGMLFVGLSMMSKSMENFAQLENVKLFLASINNAVLLVVIGAVLTAIVQSSSVMTSVAITMVVAGLISLNQGIYLTMGSNIGSCAVALIAGLSSSRNAKRTSVIHLLFNVSGVVLFMAISGILFMTTAGNVSFGTIFEGMFPGVPQTQLAMFHTVFNLLTVVIMLPLTDVLVSLVKKIIPETSEEAEEGGAEPHFYFVDEHMLKTPPIAVAMVKKEIVKMAEVAIENYNLSLDIITSLDFTHKERFEANERQLNFVNQNLVKTLVKLSQMPLNEKDHQYISDSIRTVSDLERVGDYAENIVEEAEALKEGNQEGFSVSAKAEIEYMREYVNRLYEQIMTAYKNLDIKAYEKADETEEMIDKITERMQQNHIIRLNEGTCTPVTGAQYLELANNSERIADHFINVGKTIKALI